jgi:hypothetical protein
MICEVGRTGHRQVVGEGDIYPGYRSESGGARGASHRGPDLKAPSAGTAMIRSVGVCRTTEKIGNLIVNGEEALGLPGRLEALHDMLASSGGLMTVLRPVVQAAVLPVLHSGHHYSLGSCVTRQLVRDHHSRRDALLREQLPKQALGRCGIPTALHQDVGHDPMLIDRSPEPMFLTRDADDNLVEMPLVSGCRKAPADLVSKNPGRTSEPIASWSRG